MNFTLLMLVVAGAIAETSYIIKQRNKEKKIILVGLLFLDFGALLFGIGILVNEILFLRDFKFLIDVAFWITILGLIPIFIGGFIKLKDDPYRKRLLIIASVMIIASIALLVYAIYL